MPESLRRSLICLAAAVLLSVTPIATSADDYDPERTGHPLRTAAYILHPIGVVLDTLIFRPAHWLVSREPLSTLFGHHSDD